MGIVAKPITFADTNVLTAADLNGDLDPLYAEFNGNIDDDNIKAAANIDGSKLLAASIPGSKLQDTAITEAKQDYTSLQVVRAGPNHPGGNGVRHAYGTKTFALVAGLASVTVTFSTDSANGNPAFSAAPYIVGTVEYTGGGTNHHFPFYITAKLASSFTFRISSILTTGTPGSVDGADVSSLTFHWHAIGPV